MIHSDASALYAKAFYPRIQSVFAETSFAISTIAACLVGSPDLVVFLNHPFIETSRKEGLCWNLFGNFANDHTLQLLRLLISRKKVGILPAIHYELTRLYLTEHAMQEITIHSAVELEQDEQKTLNDTLASLLGKKVYSHYSVDPALLAGLLIHIGSIVVDTSIRKQLQSLCEHYHKNTFIH